MYSNSAREREEGKERERERKTVGSRDFDEDRTGAETGGELPFPVCVRIEDFSTDHNITIKPPPRLCISIIFPAAVAHGLRAPWRSPRL